MGRTLSLGPKLGTARGFVEKQSHRVDGLEMEGELLWYVQLAMHTFPALATEGVRHLCLIRLTSEQFGGRFLTWENRRG